MNYDDMPWACDAPVSMPEPLPHEVPGLVPMDGFTFTEWGLRPDLNEADHEALSTPTFAPEPAVKEFHDA